MGAAAPTDMQDTASPEDRDERIAPAGGPFHGRRRFSETLLFIANAPVERITVAHILTVCGDRAFGALMLVFAAPNVLPMPPGTSAVLGAPLLFITAQLMIGRTTLWLPRFLTERSIARTDFAAMAGRLVPRLVQCEAVLRPRLTVLIGPVQDRVIGAAALFLAIVLFLPIPFANIPTAFAISAFAIGLLERDGIAVLVGWAATAGCIGILFWIGGALIAAFNAFVAYLWPGL